MMNRTNPRHAGPRGLAEGQLLGAGGFSARRRLFSAARRGKKRSGASSEHAPVVFVFSARLIRRAACAGLSSSAPRSSAGSSARSSARQMRRSSGDKLWRSASAGAPRSAGSDLAAGKQLPHLAAAAAAQHCFTSCWRRGAARGGQPGAAATRTFMVFTRCSSGRRIQGPRGHGRR